MSTVTINPKYECEICGHALWPGMLPPPTPPREYVKNEGPDTIVKPTPQGLVHCSPQDGGAVHLACYGYRPSTRPGGQYEDQEQARREYYELVP